MRIQAVLHLMLQGMITVSWICLLRQNRGCAPKITPLFSRESGTFHGRARGEGLIFESAPFLPYEGGWLYKAPACSLRIRRKGFLQVVFHILEHRIPNGFCHSHVCVIFQPWGCLFELGAYLSQSAIAEISI